MGFVIRYATSTDGGVTWERHPTPVIEPGTYNTWNTRIRPGDVIKEDGLFKMWYTGGTGEWAPAGPTTAQSIGYATSPDGIAWTLYDDPATTEPPYHLSDPVLRRGALFEEFDHLWASSASVRRTDAGYELWYDGLENPTDPGGIGYATSPDGIAWKKHRGNPILTVVGAPLAGALWQQSVLFYDGRYHMWLSLYRNDAPPAYSHIGYATAPLTVAIESDAAPSESAALRPPYPNPAAADVSLTYRVRETAYVTLAVYDLLGREVGRLVDGSRTPGEHVVEWDRRDAKGRSLSAGLYVVRLRAGDLTQSRTVLLLR